METMICHIIKMHLSLRTIFCLHLSGPIEKINIHKKMSEVFNVGLITSWDASSSNGFSVIFNFSLIFMNMQMR